MASRTDNFPRPPATRQEPVTETLHDVTIKDPYRWLENSHSPEVQRWTEQQNAYTASILKNIPHKEEMHRRLAEIHALGTLMQAWMAGSYTFFFKRQGSQNQPVLYVREGFAGTTRVLLDPNNLSNDETITIDWCFSSKDGKLLAYGLSSGGDELSTLHVLDVTSGKHFSEKIPHTRAASVAWLPDGSGFYYTRYPNPGTTSPGEEFYYRHVYFHQLGTDPEQDPKIFGQGRPAHELYQLLVSPDGRHLLVHARQGWAKNELYLRDSQSSDPFIPLTRGADALYYGRILGDHLFVWTNEGASNYRVFFTSVRTPGREYWRELIPETKTVIQNFELVKDRIAILGLRQASYVIQIYSRDGVLEHEAPLPTYGTVDFIDGDPESEEILFTFSSFCVPPTIYRYNVKRRTLDVYEQLQSQIESDRYEVEQIWYSSKDGTKVSMFLVHRRDLPLNGDNPTALTGYGGFNVGRFPSFSPAYYWWIEQGGVLALANLRGGGEFGEKWHRAGMLDQKQNVFDDFTCAAEWLIQNKYTRPERLGIIGRSNGGLLVGAAMTQRPDLFKAVVCGVPLLDMLRYQHFLVAKLWIPEYGCSEDAEQYRWLYAYSPYHHIQKDVHYPSVLFHTAESDSRVDPMHARKMAALMQETVKGKSLVLLRLEARAGHGIGKPVSKVIDEQVDTWGFLSWQLGLP